MYTPTRPYSAAQTLLVPRRTFARPSSLPLDTRAIAWAPLAPFGRDAFASLPHALPASLRQTWATRSFLLFSCAPPTTYLRHSSGEGPHPLRSSRLPLDPHTLRSLALHGSVPPGPPDHHGPKQLTFLAERSLHFPTSLRTRGPLFPCSIAPTLAMGPAAFAPPAPTFRQKSPAGTHTDVFPGTDLRGTHAAGHERIHLVRDCCRTQRLFSWQELSARLPFSRQELSAQRRLRVGPTDGDGKSLKPLVPPARPLRRRRAATSSQSNSLTGRGGLAIHAQGRSPPARISVIRRTPPLSLIEHSSVIHTRPQPSNPAVHLTR